MRIQLCDRATGASAGEVEIPDDVLEAARKVYNWMQDNNMINLCGLHCSAVRIDKSSVTVGPDPWPRGAFDPSAADRRVRYGTVDIPKT